MAKFYKTILTVPLAISSFFVAGQHIERYNSFSYTVNDGMLQSTLKDIAVDKNNFTWFSFPNGIQKFDGKIFTIVPIQPGLPDDKMVSFLNVDGDILLSHSNGISKYEISNNKFTQVYVSDEKKPAQFIGLDGNIIYFYTVSGNIKGLDAHTFNVISNVKTGFADTSFNNDYIPKFGDNIINHKVAITVHSCLYLWDLRQGKLLYRSNPIEELSQYLLRLKNEHEVYYYSYRINNALQLHHFPENTNEILYIRGKDDQKISRCVIYPWRNKLLISFSDRLYETDSTMQVLKTELVNFQNRQIGGSSGIWKLKADNFGNLWLITIQDGVKKILGNNYPLKYYGSESENESKVLSLFADKESNIILGGTVRNGLLVFDTLQRLVSHIKFLPGTNTAFSVNHIIKTARGKYLLFPVGQKKVCQLSTDDMKTELIDISNGQPTGVKGLEYFGNVLFQDDKHVISQSQGRFYKTDLVHKTIREFEITTSYVMSGLFYHGKIITHANDELLFIDTSDMEIHKRVPFRNTSYVRCFAKDADDNIYVGCNKGIFKIDGTGKVLYQWKKENGLPDDCIYAMAIDNEGLLWCSTNRGIFRLNRDNTVLLLTKDDGLQENEFNTNVVQKTADGELFFGGVNGISSFYPSAINSHDEKINLFFSRIRINNEDLHTDTAPWNIQKINVDYDESSLSFDFIAMANNNPNQYIYQYRMEGIDKGWIQNNGLETVHYYLQPGKYVFSIYASRYFDKDANPMKQVTIIISAPFWKTWWFRLIGAVLLLAVLILGINRYNRRRYKDKIAVFEAGHKIQLERERISRDLHDNIGAYVNAVLYNTELLEKEKEDQSRKELMQDLKFASKDIITSLRETIWALQKTDYTAEDCFFRIKNFIQPLAKYYQQIDFTVDGQVPSEKLLHYTTALNLVRIIQEAVTNSIKYSGASSIMIISRSFEEQWELTVSDNGKGFDINNIPAGNGLNNMKQRAADSGFVLDIRSGEGNGTSVNIALT